MSSWTGVAADLGQAATGLALLLGALGGGWAYFKAKRREAAHWIFEVFQPFQISAEFDQGKKLLDYRYKDIVEPLLGEMVFGCDKTFDDSAQDLCTQIDRVLNYLEHVCYLEKHGHISIDELETYFGFWFGLLKEPHRGAMRRFCANFGYKLLAEYSNAQSEEFLLLYGTLKSGLADHRRLKLDEALSLEGTVTVPGDLYDLGDFPGLVKGSGTVQAELFKVKDISVLGIIDEHEEWSRDISSTLFRRVAIQIRHPSRTVTGRTFPWTDRPIDAWIYYYNRQVEARTKIESGCWTPGEKLTYAGKRERHGTRTY